MSGEMAAEVRYALSLLLGVPDPEAPEGDAECALVQAVRRHLGEAREVRAEAADYRERWKEARAEVERLSGELISRRVDMVGGQMFAALADSEARLAEALESVVGWVGAADMPVSASRLQRAAEAALAARPKREGGR